MNARRWRAAGGRIVLAGCAAQCIFFLATLVAAWIPNGAIVSHLRAAIASGELTSNSYPSDGLGVPIDKFSECIAVTNGLGNPHVSGFVAAAVAAPDLGACNTTVPALRAWKPRTSPPPAFQNYDRYWQGYGIITRPLLAGFGLGATRGACGVLMVGSLMVLAGVVARRIGVTAAVCLLGGLALADPWFLAASIPHAISMAVLAAGAAVSLHRWRIDSRMSWVMFPMLTGCAYGFVDLMTYPALAVTLTVSLVMLRAHRCAPDPVRRIGMVATAGVFSLVAWTVGYAGTWATKWIIDIGTFGISAFRRDIWSEITMRVGTGGFSSGRAIHQNLLWWGIANPAGNWLLIALGVIVGVAAVRAAWIRRVDAPETAAVVLCTPAAITFAFYAVIRNQSFVQAFYTFRDVSGSVVAVASPAAGWFGGALVAVRGRRRVAGQASEESPADSPDSTAPGIGSSEVAGSAGA